MPRMLWDSKCGDKEGSPRHSWALVWGDPQAGWCWGCNREQLGVEQDTLAPSPQWLLCQHPPLQGSSRDPSPLPSFPGAQQHRDTRTCTETGGRRAHVPAPLEAEMYI